MEKSLCICPSVQMPVEASSLANIEVGNLDVPLCRGIFTRNEAGGALLPVPPFCYRQPMNQRHAARYSESTKERKDGFFTCSALPSPYGDAHSDGEGLCWSLLSAWTSFP
jgi:hypothetical protein